jgi:hypothetical protein
MNANLRTEWGSPQILQSITFRIKRKNDFTDLPISSNSATKQIYKELHQNAL